MYQWRQLLLFMKYGGKDMLPEVMFLIALIVAYFAKVYFDLSTAMYFGVFFLLIFMLSEKF